MKTLDARVVKEFAQLSEAFCNDVKEPHDPNRQMEILAGTMQPDLIDVYDLQQERERKYVVKRP